MGRHAYPKELDKNQIYVICRENLAKPNNFVVALDDDNQILTYGPFENAFKLNHKRAKAIKKKLKHDGDNEARLALLPIQMGKLYSEYISDRK